jgi:hypothetical protein
VEQGQLELTEFDYRVGLLGDLLTTNDEDDIVMFATEFEDNAQQTSSSSRRPKIHQKLMRSRRYQRNHIR